MTSLGDSLLYANRILNLDRSYYPIQDEIVKWCISEFGPCRNEVWDWLDVFGHTTFYFKNDKDANWFILRWM
jgi:hypothetical protein